MQGRNGVHEARSSGEASWPAMGYVRVVTDPDQILSELAKDGFSECTREVLSRHRGCPPFGGLWQGLRQDTGAVASAVWINDAEVPRAIVFVDIDSEPVARSR